MQTIYYSINRRIANCKFPIGYEHEYIKLLDGGQTSLCWPTINGSRVNLEDKAPLVILLAGLTGGTHDVYIYKSMNECIKAGLGCVLLNHRGCSKIKITTPQIYCAGFTSDLSEATIYLNANYPNHTLYAAGFSLGANILINYLGEMGSKSLIRGAISVSNPFDLMEVENGMAKSYMGNMYRKMLGNHQIKKAKEHIEVLGPYYKNKYGKDLSEELNKVKRNYDFDTLLTSKMFPYKTAYSYYRQSSCLLKLNEIAVPCLLVHSEDDPIACYIPYDEVNGNGNIIMAVVKCGGHVAFYDGLIPNQWLGTPIREFVKAVESLHTK